MQKQKLPPQYAQKLLEYDLGGIDLSGAVLIRYDRGEWFLVEGSAIEYIYIIVSGKSKVCMSEEGGRNLILCYYVSDGIMGDVELMMGRREAISSVQALTPVTCIGLPLGKYAPILLSHLPFVLRLGKGLAEKLHASVASTTGIILKPFEARFCAYLLQSAQNGFFSERLTDTAEQLGVSYRHLLRRLKALCEQGLLEKRKGGYSLLNEPELRKRAAE